MNGPLAYTQTQSGQLLSCRNNGIFPPFTAHSVPRNFNSRHESLFHSSGWKKYFCGRRRLLYVQRQILYDVGGGTINQLPVAVCVCAREREREANTAGRVCFLDAKQLLPKASAAVMRTKASVGDALISV
jgi:hypothetical protein